VIQTCRWTLDTCGCVLDQQYDDADYAGTMQVTSIRRCEFHAALTTQDAVTHSVGQMKRKNEAEARMQQFFPSAELKSWSFSGTGTDRVLTVVITGITSGERTQIQVWADGRFGAGKIVVA
jgi:hypothetical protein